MFSRVLRTENVPSSQHTNVLAAKGGNAENTRRVNNRGGNRAFENRGNIQVPLCVFTAMRLAIPRRTARNCIIGIGEIKLPMLHLILLHLQTPQTRSSQ